MSYYGDSASEKAAMRLEAKIKRIYAEAARDVEQKILHYTDTFKKRDAEMQKKLKSGEISQADYDNWKSRIVFRGKRWNNVRDTIWSQLYHTRQTTTDMINGERKAMFQNVVNYSQYQIDKDFNFSLSFNIYDNATVTRLIKEDPDLVPDVKYPVPGRDYAWSKKQIASAATQGVIQGESIPEISRRIANKLSSANMVSMTRCARTAMTGAHNSGRIEAMHNAQDLGIKVQKLWIATLDSRTRDWHRDLDGQLAEVDEPFYSHFGEIMYPGDPNARPANVWCCRCSLGWEYPEYKNQYDTRAARDEDKESETYEKTIEVKDMTYREWERSKQKEQQKSAEHSNSSLLRRASQSVQKTDYDEPKNLSDVLSTLYDNHRTHNNLATTSASDLKTAAGKFGTQSIFEPNLGKMDDKGKEMLTDIISRYGEQYDTALSSVKIMDKQAAMSTAFASVSYNYETNTATLLINPIKCNNTEKLVDRLRTLKEKGYISRDIPESKLQEYVYTHEFAHTLINIAQPLQKNRNFAKSDYDAIAQTRSEIEAVYKEYCSRVGDVEKRFKDAEFSYIMGASNGDEARKLSEQLKEVKISDYSLTNADEFMAECFACTKLYDTKNEYVERCMRIIEEHYGRK